MATTKTSRSRKNTKKTVKKEETVDMGKLQSKICREIMDTAEVTKSAVANEIIAKLSESNTRDDLKAALNQVNATIDLQANMLVDRVIKTLK